MIIGLLTFFIITTGVLAYLAYINYIKYVKAVKYAETYVQFISTLWYKFNYTKQRMDEIDMRGAFKADDEVGHTFTSLQECINTLYDFITIYVNKEETKN